MELIEILKNNAIFKGLTDQEIQKLADICYEKEYKTGELIFEDNSVGSAMYVIIKGQVDIQMNMGMDDELATVHVIKEGEIFGELSLVDRAPRSAAAKAAGVTKTFILEADKFDKLVQNNSHIGYIFMRNIAHIVSSRLRETNIRYTESLIWERLSSDNE